MNIIFSQANGWIALIGIVLSITSPAVAGLIQPVSIVSSNQAPASGGNSDSSFPILSQDGSYVLFSSTANNLVLLNNAPIPALVPARFNVFLRERTNQNTTLVSVNTNATGGGNGDSFPVMLSTNGQLALFESSASNLVAADTNKATDIFVRNLIGGATVLVSVNTNNLPGNGESRRAAMTPDGRFVAFVSEASDLVPDDTNKVADIFLRDLQTLATTRISVGATSTNPAAVMPVGSSEWPQISSDGRYIAFSSSATNLVTGVRTVGDIYVHDRIAGTNIWASSGMRAKLQTVTGKTNGVSHNLALSADGKFVAYQASLLPLSTATNNFALLLRYNVDTAITDLIHTNANTALPTAEETRNLDITPDGMFVAFVSNSNGVSGSTTCVQVWNAIGGSTTIASGNLSGAVTSNSYTTRPVIDPTGRYVAFLSNATNLTANAVPGTWHLYHRDLLTATTSLVDADTNGVGSPVPFTAVPSLSADGRFVAFECGDGGLVPNDSNRNQDVFVRDVVAGTNELISACHPALTSATPNSFSMFSVSPSSADGRYIAFTSDADNLSSGDTNGFRDVFLRDLASGTNFLVSADMSGVPGNGFSSEPTPSGDGRYVAFTSSSTNLVAGDTNKVTDVFVRDLFTGTTALTSLKPNGSGPGNKASYSPALSADGRWLLFRSQATDLASGTFTGTENLFFRDLFSGTNFALTTGGVVASAMTYDGRFVAFYGIITGAASRLYVWDVTLNARVFTNMATGITGLAISPNGNRVAYHTTTELRLEDRASNTNWLVSTIATNSIPSPRFSADGNWLCYSRYVSPWHQTYLYDIPNRMELPVSHAPNTNASGSGGHSDLPDISPDGRFVSYRTLATNLVSGISGFTRQIILYDRQTGSNSLVSLSRFTGGAADDHTTRASFSADGQTLLLQSWAADLVGGDFNHTGDVQARAIFTAVILPPAAPGQGPWLYWPFVPGNNYSVEFKDSLAHPLWQNLFGNFTNLGVKAWLQDNTLANPQRYYRIRTY